MGGWGRVSTRVKSGAAWLDSLPWWGTASAGAALIVLLSMPVTMQFGSAQWKEYGWYTTADDTLVTGLILDQVQYTRLVDATAGEAPSTQVAPFSNRALAPWLAGRLPLDAPVALYLVNLASLILGTFALARLAMDLTRRRLGVLVAVALWAISIPVIKYTGDGFVDPAAVGLLPVVLLALWRRWMLVALGVFWLAVWAKETALVLLLVPLARIWLDRLSGQVGRLLHAAAWVVVGLLAYATAYVPGGGHSLVFAPWVPETLTLVWSSLRFNTASLPRLIAFGATVTPAFLGTVVWWRSRRRGEPVLADQDAIPLVLGCAAGALVGLSALPAALLDGRSVWTTLPMGALLVGAWAATSDRPTAWVDVRGFVRLAVPVGLVFVAAWVVSSALLPPFQGPEQISHSPDATPAFGKEFPLRFSSLPDGPEDVEVTTFEGADEASLEIPGEGPVLVRFESEGPITLGGPDGDLLAPSRVRTGTVMFDPTGSRVLDVSADGAWTLEVFAVSTALFWDSLSPIIGEGPNVLVFPGGQSRAIQVDWSSRDTSDRIRLVGRCHLGDCGELPRDGVIPPGTEALVIDASGQWTLVPLGSIDEPDQPVLGPDGIE